MNLPIEKIEFYSRNDYYVISADKQIRQLHNRKNSDINIIRVYHTKLIYNDYKLFDNIPTVIFPLGMIVFPSVQMAVDYVREVQTVDEPNYSDMMLDIFKLLINKIYKINPNLNEFYVSKNKKYKKLKTGFYTISELNKEMNNNIIHKYKILSNNNSMLKELERDNSLEYSLITEFIMNNKKLFKNYESHNYIFEIVSYNGYGIVNMIPIPQNIYNFERDYIISHMTGNIIMIGTDIDKNIINIYNDFILSIKLFMNFDYYLEDIDNKDIKRKIIIGTLSTFATKLLIDKADKIVLLKDIFTNIMTIRKYRNI